MSRNRASLIASLAFVVAMAGLATASNREGVVYALSFWHYLVYALAFCFRSASLAMFKRDALITRSVSLGAFGLIYFAAPFEPVSLVVLTLGLLLNASAVLALGTDRTYYGQELEELPPKRIGAFPYSFMSHPMLIGNMLAFGGTLLHPEFRAKWWPLAALHVVLNLAVILMEVYAKPRPKTGDFQRLVSLTNLLLSAALWGLIGLLSAEMVAVWVGSFARSAHALFFGFCIGAYAGAIVECYSWQTGRIAVAEQSREAARRVEVQASDRRPQKAAASYT